VAEKSPALSGEGNRTSPLLNKKEIIIDNNALTYWLTLK